MFTHLYKQFVVFDSKSLFPILNVRFYSKSEISNQSKNCILSLLKEYDFTHQEASNFISKRPILLSITPKTLKAKLDFFKSVQMTNSDLSNMLSVDPKIFRSSLQNQIIPTYNYLKSILKTNDKVNLSIKRSTWPLKRNIKKEMEPNLAVLRECEVPDDKIEILLKTEPRSLVQDPVRFMEAVREVKETGFDPGKTNFVVAIHVMARIGKSGLERKKEIFGKWGWSDGEIRTAFKKSPRFLETSDKKIEAVMNFLVKEMRWNALQVAKCHYAVMFSLENWTAPRCLVYQFLLSKGLVKEIPLLTLLTVSKKRFSASYVAQYRLVLNSMNSPHYF